MRPLKDRLAEKVQVTDSGCWEFQGRRNNMGYGRIWLGPGLGVGYAHRASYVLHVGDIPAGLTLDHLCRNRACVNPRHLQAVTHAENMRRGVGFAGVNARKTECVHGHPFTTENTRVRADGTRNCRTCDAVASRRRRKQPTSRSAA